MKIVKILRRVLIYILIITAAFLLQTSVFSLFRIISTVPNLLLILTFSFGFIYGSTTGMLCGMLAGFFMDNFYTVPAGFFMLIFIVIGYINGIFTNYYYDDYITLPVILCVISELIYNGSMMLMRFFTVGSMNLRYSLLHIVFPEILFSLLITLVLYRVFLKANRYLDLYDDKRGQRVA